MTIDPTFDRAWPVNQCWARHPYWHDRCQWALGHPGDHQIRPLGICTRWHQSVQERWIAQRPEWEDA